MIGLPQQTRVNGVGRHNKLLEFVFDFIYVDLQYDDICLTFTAGLLGYDVKVHHGYDVKQCPRIMINNIFDWH